MLVNNAGYGYLSAVEEGDDAEVRALFDTNFFGAVDMIKAVLPGMRAQGDGHIVNVSSMTGIVTNPPNTYYSCTKHALEALTEGLAKEVGPLGIKVCAIEPGAFQTDYITRSMHQADGIEGYAHVDGAQGAHQGVRRAPPRRPGQARRRGAAARRHGRPAAPAPPRPGRAQRVPREDGRVDRDRSTSGSPSPPP